MNETRKPVLLLRADDDPEANGRVPVIGEVRWTLKVPLEDGTELHLQFGRKSHVAFLDMLQREALDDAAEGPIQ